MMTRAAVLGTNDVDGVASTQNVGGLVVGLHLSIFTTADVVDGAATYITKALRH